MQLYLQQITHGLARDGTQASIAADWQQTAWAMA